MPIKITLIGEDEREYTAHLESLRAELDRQVRRVITDTLRRCVTAKTGEVKVAVLQCDTRLNINLETWFGGIIEWDCDLIVLAVESRSPFERRDDMALEE